METIYEEETCNICFEDINTKTSISACSCKNKLHVDCLLQWIEYKASIECEICNARYVIPNDIIIEYINNYNNTNSNNVESYTDDLDGYNTDTYNTQDSDESNTDSGDNIDNENNMNQQNKCCVQFRLFYVLFIMPVLCIGTILVLLKYLTD